MTELSSVVEFDQLCEEQHPTVGGKCASLGTMGKAGLPVPPGFAVTTTVFDEAKNKSGTMDEINALLHAEGASSQAAAQSRKIIRQWELSAEHETQIRQSYARLCELCGIDDVAVAVRSSATAEDSPDASFAGEHDTYLWVCGIESVLDRIRDCWSSLFTDRAIAYREEMGYDHNKVDMAVAVQKMVRPKSAGVAFTLDPTNGDKSGICIDSAWGFGEGVVSGEVTPDNFLVDKVMWSINRRTISPKMHAYQLVYEEGERWPSVQRVALNEEQSNAPSLTDEQILAVAKMARLAEKHYGCVQDIEWAVDKDLPDGDDVVLLQSRPETVWSKQKRSTSTTNSNLVSSIVDTLMNPVHDRKGKQPA